MPFNNNNSLQLCYVNLSNIICLSIIHSFIQYYAIHISIYICLFSETCSKTLFYVDCTELSEINSCRTNVCLWFFRVKKWEINILVRVAPQVQSLIVLDWIWKKNIYVYRAQRDIRVIGK